MTNSMGIPTGFNRRAARGLVRAGLLADSRVSC